MEKQFLISCCSECPFFDSYFQSCNNPDLPKDIKNEALNDKPDSIPIFCPLNDSLDLKQFKLTWNNASGEQTSILWLPSDTTEDNVRQLILNLLNLVELDADDDCYDWSLKAVSAPSTT
jgi:hypothetical protein